MTGNSLLPLPETLDPFVIGQMGQSLDGRVALPSGESKYLNSIGGLRHLHRLRAHVDAVLIGIGTALCDDPLLDVRLVEGKNPARIVVDPHSRLPATARLLREDGARCLVLSPLRRDLPAHVEQILPTRMERKFSPREILLTLRQEGLRNILVEGGPFTLSQFLETGCLDHLHLIIAPLLLGAGPSGVNLPPPLSLAAALRPGCQVNILEGGDVLFACDFNLTS
jgi:diaminohydroxyphosphoribosylaminopyrimidine deaminase / 5-amino-6-(5-phosphoribosylamino)uracil reductase